MPVRFDDLSGGDCKKAEMEKTKMTKYDKDRDRENRIVNTVLVILFLVGACGYTAASDAEFFAGIQTVAAASGITSSALPLIFYAVCALVIGIVIYKILTSEIAVAFISIIMVVAVILGAMYVFFWYDKTGDGVADSGIVAPVQMDGSDPALDAAYSEVNFTTAKSNALTMLSGIGLIFVLLVVFVVSAGVGLVLHWRGEVARERKNNS
jgi:hypothetical protein